METNPIENIEIVYLKADDYEEIKSVMLAAYPHMQGAYWREHQIKKLTQEFPEGQVGIRINGELAGCALSIIIDSQQFQGKHTYKEITGNYTFGTHNPNGDKLYGIDVFISPKFRGLRLGRRLYDYRKELCEKRNFARIRKRECNSCR